MAWIETILYDRADRVLKKIYDRIKGPNGEIDNVLNIHSLRPHTLLGHMTLYKSVLHNVNNTLPKWYLEAIGIYVSYLNKCDYCVDHHYAGLQRLLQDDKRAALLREAVETDALEDFFSLKFLEGMKYAGILTVALNDITQNNIHILKRVGFSDGEILEINQVASYFNYVNRTVIGMGVTTKGDLLGLSPNSSDEPTNWEHR